MSIFLLFIGIIFILTGINVRKKKWLWFHQGFVKRPVDIEKYTKYMGTLDVIAGIIFFMLTFLSFYYVITKNIAILFLLIYCVFCLYGEFKYKAK